MRIFQNVDAEEMTPIQPTYVCKMYPWMRIVYDTDAELKVSWGISENLDNIFECMRIMMISLNINGKAKVSICLHSVSNIH